MHAGLDDPDRTNRIASCASVPSRLYCKASLLPIAYIQTPQSSKEQSSVKEEEAVGPKQGLVVSSCGGWAVKATTSCAQKSPLAHSDLRHRRLTFSPLS